MRPVTKDANRYGARPFSLFALIVLSATLVSGLAQHVFAHRTVDISTETMTRLASVIVEGQVTARTSAWNSQRTKIYTTVTLDVKEYHKRDLGLDVLEIRFLGGTVGDITMAVVGQPSFQVGENAFLFLSPDFAGKDTPFVNNDHGKRTVFIDPATQQELLIGPHGRIGKAAAVAAIDEVMRPLREVDE